MRGEHVFGDFEGLGEIGESIALIDDGDAGKALFQQGFPGISIVDKRYGLADFAKSLEVAENMLTAHPNLKAFFASNESSTVGAARALMSRKSGVQLVGFDSSPSLLEDVKAS